MRSYDEQAVRARLARLGRAERAAFAAACAERLWPLFVWYAHVTGQADPSSLRTVLDDTWRAVRGPGGAPGLTSRRRGRVTTA